MTHLTTDRLELHPGSLARSEAELEGNEALAAALQARVIDWPPPLNDRGSQEWMRDWFASHPQSAEWGQWYIVLKGGDGASSGRVAIGNGGFKGEPDEEGRVEIGYSILEPYQGKGYCTEAMRALVEHAARDPRVRRVIAETLPELTASIRVMEKLGMEPIEGASEEGVLRYALVL